MTAARVHAIPDEALGNTSYVVEVARGLAVSVDPPRDPDAHLSLAAAAGARIAAVLETHVHADFVTGAPEIARATGATIHAPEAAGVAYPHSSVRPDDVLRIGDVTLRTVGTPGHTPEHLAFVLEEGGRPTAVFSGGSLIAGGAARTDLSGDELVEPLTRAQFHSLRTIAGLPDDVALRPTHGGGSFCSSGSGGRTATTIGDERGRNELLLIDDEEAFVGRFLAGLGSFPPYFLRLRDVNRAGPTPLGDLPPPRAYTPEQARDAVARGAWLIDGRLVDAWAASHPEGAVSIQVRSAFAVWLGWVVPFGAPIVLLADDDAARRAVVMSRRIGYDELAVVDGGIEAWTRAGLPTRSTEQISVEEARRRAGEGRALLDVRQRSERERARIPGSLHVELGELAAGKLPSEDDVIVHCSHGERSATAVSLLEHRGVRATHLVGGLDAWRAAGLPVQG